jgi:hypothetical protein
VASTVVVAMIVLRAPTSILEPFGKLLFLLLFHLVILYPLVSFLLGLFFLSAVVLLAVLVAHQEESSELFQASQAEVPRHDLEQ